MRLSISARLALLAFGLMLVANLGLVALVWNQIHDNAIATLRRDTIEQADALAELWRTSGADAIRRAASDAYARGDETLIAMVVDRDGHRVAGRGPDMLPNGELDETDFRIATIGQATPWSRREAGIAIRPAGGYWLVSGRLLDDWQQQQHVIERALAGAALFSLLLCGLGGLVLTRYVTQRLDRVAAVVEAVGQGDLSRRVPLAADGGDAFDRLAGRLNAMLDKIERLMGELRVMTDSVAHDLRSPLARLRAKAESALLQDDDAAREAALGGLIAETDLLMRMLSTLIEISRSESVSHDRLTPTAPAALAEEVAELYAPLVEDAGMAFRTDIAADLPEIALHRELISQALTNLIDNALRHAASGGEIMLSATSAGRAIRFTVADRGPGIAASDRDQARRRFGRLDEARTLPGAGLGLALVDSVARLHGGTLELADNDPGLAATIILPLFDRRAAKPADPA